ncbi:hypothetical protein [Trueperella pyogenes]|uniref:hypothetical protein n=1 Tax=Trueperella pyogenes TaxID=1661 RepID=UPI0032544683
MTEEDLINACTDLGVHVVFVPLDLAGAYVHELNLILIGSRLPASSQRAVLAPTNTFTPRAAIKAHKSHT